MNFRLSLGFCLGLAACIPCFSAGGRGTLIRPMTRPTTRLTTRPATQPAKPLATVTADAAPLLQSLSSSYSKLKSLELAGTLTLKVDENGQVRSHEAAFTALMAAPNRFRHEVKDDVLLVSSGKKASVYSPRANTYFQLDLRPEKLRLRDLPPDFIRLLPLQDLSLMLAISPDPAGELKELATAISKLPDEKIENANCVVLGLALPEGEAPAKVFIDPKTQLVRRVVFDYKPMLVKSGREDIAMALFTVDYTTIKPDAEVTPERFEWSPPHGARAVAGPRVQPDIEVHRGGH